MHAEIALKNNFTSSMELLEIWWRQVVEARILMEENNIPGSPNEIELAIADIETIVSKAEPREEILREGEIRYPNATSKIKEDDSDQMRLF